MLECNRREFIKTVTAGVLGVSLPSLAAEKKLLEPVYYRRARSVIYVNIKGGMSHIDTFDPKPESPDQAGPLRSVKTNVTGIHLNETLPKLAKCMDKIAIIRSMTSTAGAHEQAQYLMKTGYEMRGTIRHPEMGSWVLERSGWLNTEMPGYVTIGSSGKNLGNGFMNSMYAALPINDPSSGISYGKQDPTVPDHRYKKRIEIMNKLNQKFLKKAQVKKVKSYVDIYDDAMKMMKSKDFHAFDLSEENEVAREKYGDSKVGQGCLLARRLVENGVRFIEVNSTGWDTHDDNFDRLETLCYDLDAGLSALIQELHERGLLEETLVVLGTEFGRTPDIVQKSKGRNHYPKAFSMMMAGGGIVGGQVFGKTNKTGHEVVENPVKFGDVNATMAFALGIDPAQRIFSPSGRPFVMGYKGKVITDLFS